MADRVPGIVFVVLGLSVLSVTAFRYIKSQFYQYFTSWNRISSIYESVCENDSHSKVYFYAFLCIQSHKLETKRKLTLENSNRQWKIKMNAQFSTPRLEIRTVHYSTRRSFQIDHLMKNAFPIPDRNVRRSATILRISLRIGWIGLVILMEH